MKILVAQLNPTIGDFKGNTEKMIGSIENARAQKADIVLFPEMSICGYPPEDLLMHASFLDEMEKALERIIEASFGITVVAGLVRRNPFAGEKALFNTAAVIQNGKLLGFHDKWLLPTYDVFDERRYFEPGLNMQVWEIKGKRVGVLICEDVWQHGGSLEYTHYQRDPVLELARFKPDLVLNLSASPYQFHKPDVRIKICAKTAKTLGVPLVLCCQVGGNDQLVFDGYSGYIDGKGQLRQLAAGFREDEMLVDLEAPTPKECVFRYDPIQDLYAALVLGVKDYFHKQGFKKGCLGLSGGIDSALVACIAVDALGKDNVLGVLMPSRFNTSSSTKDAEDLARNLGIEILHVPIEEAYQGFLSMLEPHFSGKSFDVTEENLQARIRGNILMAISNKLGYLVLSTGNKSELALGYCTLYGDMCGGLSAISDVSKMQVYALAKWINREREIIPRSTIEKPPSAELRPNQKDTDTLPEYAVVDAVLQGYVEDLLSPEEIVKKTGISLEVVLDLIHKIHSAEYKRRQAAPGIRVSKKSLRVGRRYPIVQRWM
jgi:NAD+ synthase (glutamine-hydrolysing)